MAPERRKRGFGDAGLLISIIAIAGLLPLGVSATPRDDNAKRADRILRSTPLIDGHNDFPGFIRKTTKNQIYNGKLPFEDKLSGHTDLKRIRKGRLGGQFWSVYVPCPADVNAPIEFPNIDVTRRLVDLYPKDLQFCGDSACAKHAFRKGKIGSFIGIEGGHQIGSSINALRQAYDLGARYMTITHNCDNAFATAASSVIAGKPDHGLTDYGRELIKEMNRLGMLVDLSHVSHDTMRDILKVTKAPVIFSHSSAYALSKHMRNAPDDVLRSVTKNGGVVMVTFVNAFLNVDDPDSVTVEDAVDHIFHIAKVAGWDHVGIGGDYDGTVDLPKGLEDVSTYPFLIERVLERGATEKQARKLVGENVLRVWAETEKISKKIRASGALPIEEPWSGRNWTAFSQAKRSSYGPVNVPALLEHQCD
ncbi:hypothetical protein FQN57_002518 [Myotisia sp. PD_48]|nr:hypothetical protein FQN57_002518 [Myotisia sp. PD_48]